MTNLLVFAVNNLLDRFTTQGSQAGNRSLIVLGLFMTASELGALNRQLRGLRLTAFVRDSSANDQSSGQSSGPLKTRSPISIPQLLKVGGTRETAMDKLGSPDKEDYGEVGRLGDLFSEVFDQNRLVGLTDHDKRPGASEANKKIAREWKERETRVVITVILNAGTLRSSLDGRPFPTCLPDNYAVFPPDARNCKKCHSSMGCGSASSVYASRPEDSNIVEVAAIPPRTSSTTNETTARSATTTPRTTLPVSSTMSDFEEEEDPDVPAFDYVSGAEEDDDEDEDGTDSDVVEVPLEEKPPLPAARTETSPSELQVTFNIGAVSGERAVQRTPSGELTEGVSSLQVRSPETTDRTTPMTARERAKANVRAAKAAGASHKRTEETKPKPRPISPTDSSPSLECDETSSIEAEAHELARQTYQGISMQIQTARPLQVPGVGRGEAIKIAMQWMQTQKSSTLPNMDILLQAQLQRLQGISEEDQRRRERMAAQSERAEAVLQRVDQTHRLKQDANVRAYEESRRQEQERLHQREEQSSYPRETVSLGNLVKDRSRTKAKFGDFVQERPRSPSRDGQRSRSGKRQRDTKETRPSAKDAPSTRKPPDPNRSVRPKDEGKYQHYSQYVRTQKENYMSPAWKKTPTSSPQGKTLKLSSVVRQVPPSRATNEEDRLFEGRLNPNWTPLCYDDGKRGHFTKKDILYGDITFRQWVRRTTNFNHYKDELRTLGLFGKDQAVEYAKDIIVLVRAKMYAAVFGAMTPEPSPMPSWLTGLTSTPLGTQVPKPSTEDNRLMEMDGRYVSMLGWEILLSQLQYLYDALMSRRKGFVYGGSLRPHSPLALWALHVFNLIMVRPHVVRWHVIENRYTAWKKWHEARSMVEQARLARRFLPGQIEAYNRRNVIANSTANSRAIQDFNRIRVECQEQQLIYNRKSAPTLDLSRVVVELPDEDWFPSPAPKKRTAQETVSTPVDMSTVVTPSAPTDAENTSTTPKVDDTTVTENMELGSSQESNAESTKEGSISESLQESGIGSTQGSLELEDVYTGVDPMKEINEMMSSQGETPMDTTETAADSGKSSQDSNPISEAIVEGVVVLDSTVFESNTLQKEYQGTTGRGFTPHEYHPTPTSLSPLNTADKKVAEKYFDDPAVPVANTEADELLQAASTAHGVVAVSYDSHVVSGNGQRVEQNKSGVATVATQP